MSSNCDEFYLCHFQNLIEGKLNGTERNFSHDKREIACVEATKRLVPIDVYCALEHAAVLADLEVLLNNFKGISH